MQAGELKTLVTADVSGLDKGLATAEKRLNDFGKSARSAQFATSSLSRVVSDAPFGFIAIQNNLDPLLQSFRQLKTETGSTGAAFASLLTRANLAAIGFTAVGSALTTLIQKYGSFEAVLKKVFNQLSEDQLRFNKALISGAEAAGIQVNRIDALVSASANLSLGVENTAAANALLAKEVDKVIESIDLKKKGLQGVNGELVDYAKKVIIARVQLQAFSSVFGDLSKELVQAQLDGVTFGDKFVAAISKIGVAIQLLQQGRFKELRELTRVDFLDIATERYNQRLDEIRRRQAELQKLQNKFVEDQIRQGVKLVDLFGGGGETKTEPKALPIPKPKTQELADFSKFIARGYVTELDNAVSKEFEKNNPLSAPLKDFVFDPIDLITANINLEEFNKQQARIAQFQEAQKKAILDRNRRAFEELQAQQTEFTQILSQGLAQPLGDLIFNVLDKGAKGFKGFADAAIAAIKRIVAQLVATKLIQLLASLTPFGKGLALGKGIGQFLGSGLSFVGRTAAPDFSGGGLTGGVNLTGQVVFVQRGSDLVGVLSRTNNRINRVG